MSSKFNLRFWEKDYMKRYELGREAREILNWLVNYNPKIAERFIKDKYEREVYREDIIDTYCSKYDSEKINKLLNDLEYDELSEEEIKEYQIKRKEEETEEFE